MRGKSVYEDAYLALSKGEIDGLGITENQLLHIQGDKSIRRVFENYKEAEASYFRKTGILHIMHVLTVRKSIVEQHPDLLLRDTALLKIGSPSWTHSELSC